jgi:hypothetical protein
VPSDVTRWAQGAPVIGEGSLWTTRSATEVPPVFQDGSWHLKFPWYLRPPGLPSITGHRIDGLGVFHADASQAVDVNGTWVASYLQFSSVGCWEVTGRYRSSTITIQIAVPKT